MIKSDVSLNFKSIEVLHEGLSNKTFLVDGMFVLRQKGNSDDPFNSTRAEGQIIAQLEGKSFVEKGISFDEEMGNKLSYYIPNTTRLKKPALDLQLKTVAKTLKKFHSLNLHINANFEPLKRLAFYKKEIDSEVNPENELNIVNKAKKLFEKYPLIVCHNDLVPGNILFKGDDVVFLDFEFAGNNIALFDIASFLSENNIEDEESIASFCNYYGNVDIHEVKEMMKFADLLWYYWAKRLYKRTQNDAFKDIAEEKLSKIS